MAVGIITRSATYYTSEFGSSCTDCLDAIKRGQEIKCWWFQSHGQRITETFLFVEDCVEYLRTESDD